MPLLLPSGRFAARSFRLLAGSLGAVLLLSLGDSASRAGTLEQAVRSICLSAFQQEMQRAGKVPPDGMADFACSCVADRIVDGTSLADAQQTCRLATVRRYPF
jgi:hypothetical protein